MWQYTGGGGGKQEEKKQWKMEDGGWKSVADLDGSKKKPESTCYVTGWISYSCQFL
jgi:hypothetical protein